LTRAQKYSIDCTFLHHFHGACARARARARSLASGIQGRRKAQKTTTNGREGGVGGKERRGEDAARNARTWNSRLAFAATPAKVRLDEG